MAIPWSVGLQGDSEAAVADILRNSPQLTSAFPNCTVSTDLRDYTNGDQWVFVTRKGGASNPWQKVDKPRIDLNFYAANRADAHDIGQICLKVMFEAQANYAGKGIRLQVVKVETGLTRSPDQLNDSDRYTLSLRLTVTPE